MKQGIEKYDWTKTIHKPQNIDTGMLYNCFYLK